MYLPQAFREDDRQAQFELIKANPLGLLITHGGPSLLANLVPFIVYPGEGSHGVLRAHVARANGQWKELVTNPDCLVVFQGPNSYITPNWYPTKADTHKVVPTWNYATVHVWGSARVAETPEWLLRQIGDLTNTMEAKSPQPWKVADAPAEFVAEQLKAIVGIEITLSRTEGKWKMSQNRTEADQRGVVAGLRATGDETQRKVADEVARAGKGSGRG